MIDRDDAIKQIKTALKKRSGKTWSVTGGRGTAWGWITVNAPPARRTWRHVQTQTPEPPSVGAVYCGVSAVTPEPYLRDGTITDYDSDPWARGAVESGRSVTFTWEVEDPSYEFGHMSPAERKELATLLGIDHAHHQGVSIPSGSDYREEYVARAKGETPAVCGKQYWD